MPVFSTRKRNKGIITLYSLSFIHVKGYCFNKENRFRFYNEIKDY